MYQIYNWYLLESYKVVIIFIWATLSVMAALFGSNIESTVLQPQLFPERTRALKLFDSNTDSLPHKSLLRESHEMWTSTTAPQIPINTSSSLACFKSFLPLSPYFHLCISLLQSSPFLFLLLDLLSLQTADMILIGQACGVLYSNTWGSFSKQCFTIYKSWHIIYSIGPQTFLHHR